MTRPATPPAGLPGGALPGAALVGAALASLVLTAIGLALVVMGGSRLAVLGLLAPTLFVGAGVVVLRNRPGNVVGRCFLVAGILLSCNQIGRLGSDLALARGWASGWAHLFAWLNSLTWFPGHFVLIAVALLYFPEGLPSPRWRWLSRFAIGAIALFVTAFTIVVWFVPVAQLQSDAAPSVGGWRLALIYLCFGCILALLPVVLAVVASLVVRYRRGSTVERLQLRWVLAAGAFTVLVELLLFGLNYVIGNSDAVQDLVEPPAFALIAVATGLAITRHGLYEIDRIVSRTVSYLVISAVLVGVYLIVVTAAALVIPDRYGSVGVATATLAAVALFVPLRSRVQRGVDRRFNRVRYDAEAMVGSFAASVRSDRSLDDVHEELLHAVRRAVAPSTATLWLAPPRT